MQAFLTLAESTFLPPFLASLPPELWAGGPEFGELSLDRISAIRAALPLPGSFQVNNNTVTVNPVYG